MSGKSVVQLGTWRSVGRSQHIPSSSDRPETPEKRIKLTEKIREVVRGGARLEEEWREIVKGERRFQQFLQPDNVLKNRYRNLILYDKTRVTFNGKPDDYIHASLVDGLGARKAYILAQAPLSNTVEEFWRMIWEQNTRVIVLLTRLQTADGHTLSASFWPPTTRTWPLKSGLAVTTEKLMRGTEFDRYDIDLRMEKMEHRSVYLFQFLIWHEDADVPPSLPDFVAKLRLLSANFHAKASCSPPIVVVCSNGASRSGVFVVYDIATRMLLLHKRVNLKAIVQCVREQRYGTIQHLRQYLFLTEAIVNFAIHTAMLSPGELDLSTFSRHMHI